MQFLVQSVNLGCWSGVESVNHHSQFKIVDMCFIHVFVRNNHSTDTGTILQEITGWVN